MEADIKLITSTSDVNLEFTRNTRFKTYHATSDSYSMKEVEPGIPFPISASSRQRLNEIARRAKELGITTSEDGLMSNLDLIKTITRLHQHSIRENNTTWTSGAIQHLIFSGDGLNTANGESHTLCCIRSLLLKWGYTSAHNHYPITNFLGSDKHAQLTCALETHQKKINEMIKTKKCQLSTSEMISVEWYCTGDLAFGLSLYGLNQASSTFGNPWIKCFDASKQPIFRQVDEMYTFGHMLPPGVGLSKDKPFKCPIDGCGFVATSEADMKLDREKWKQMTPSQNTISDKGPLWQVSPSAPRI
jgi:hypothetical protein